MHVNNEVEWHLRPDLEAEVFRILRAIPEFTITTGRGHERRSDAVVRHGGLATPITIQVKTRVSSAAAHHIVHQARQLSIPTVVIARKMTDRACEILGAEGIGSIDGLGNIHLNLPGLIMRITGEPRPKRAPPPTRLSGKSSLVVQAMLLDAERPWRVTDLAKRAGVSVGLAHRVLQRLDEEGVVESDGAGPNKTRHLANPAALLDLWAEEHRDRPLRRPAFLLAPTDRNLSDALCDRLETTAIDYALTGGAAVARIAPLVTNVAVAEVWLEATADPSAVCEDLGALEVASGPNVVFLQEPGDAPLAFRTRDNGVWTTNRFRLFLDLRRDPKRGRKQADYLRREIIGF